MAKRRTPLLTVVVCFTSPVSRSDRNDAALDVDIAPIEPPGRLFPEGDLAASDPGSVAAQVSASLGFSGAAPCSGARRSKAAVIAIASSASARL